MVVPVTLKAYGLLLTQILLKQWQVILSLVPTLREYMEVELC